MGEPPDFGIDEQNIHYQSQLWRSPVVVTAARQPLQRAMNTGDFIPENKPLDLIRKHALNKHTGASIHLSPKVAIAVQNK